MDCIEQLCIAKLKRYPLHQHSKKNGSHQGFKHQLRVNLEFRYLSRRTFVSLFVIEITAYHSKYNRPKKVWWAFPKPYPYPLSLVVLCSGTCSISRKGIPFSADPRNYTTDSEQTKSSRTIVWMSKGAPSVRAYLIYRVCSLRSLSAWPLHDEWQTRIHRCWWVSHSRFHLRQRQSWDLLGGWIGRRGEE